MKVMKEARAWIEYTLCKVPERMPNIRSLYDAGAEYVSVDEFDKGSGCMVLGVIFPADLAKVDDLWLCVANCQHDGVKRVSSDPVKIQILTLGSYDYKYKIENGPYGGLTEW